MTDFVGFIIMVYTMFVQPALYIVFGLITVPLTLFFFVGMFANWLNPLRFIFQSISDFGTWSLIWLGLGSFVAIELLKLSLVGLHLIPGVGLLSWLALTAGEIGLVALIAQFVINIIPSIIVGGIIVLGVVAIGAIVIVLQEVLNIGINVPSYLSYWILLPMAAILAVAGILMSLTLMLAADAIAVMTQLPFIVGNLSFGLLTASWQIQSLAYLQMLYLALSVLHRFPHSSQVHLWWHRVGLQQSSHLTCSSTML